MMMSRGENNVDGHSDSCDIYYHIHPYYYHQQQYQQHHHQRNQPHQHCDTDNGDQNSAVLLPQQVNHNLPPLLRSSKNEKNQYHPLFDTDMAYIPDYRDGHGDPGYGDPSNQHDVDHHLNGGHSVQDHDLCAPMSYRAEGKSISADRNSGSIAAHDHVIMNTRHRDRHADDVKTNAISSSIQHPVGDQTEGYQQITIHRGNFISPEALTVAGLICGRVNGQTNKQPQQHSVEREIIKFYRRPWGGSRGVAWQAVIEKEHASHQGTDSHTQGAERRNWVAGYLHNSSGALGYNKVDSSRQPHPPSVDQVSSSPFLAKPENDVSNQRASLGPKKRRNRSNTI